jgi:hypothetical protein
MATINSNIALGVQPIQLADPMAQYGKISAIQSAQQQNELARMKMSEYERARAEEDQVRNYLAQSDLSKPEARTGLVKFGKTGLAYSKALSEQDTARTEAQIKQTKLVADKLALLPEAYRMADTPEAYLALHQSVHADPVLGPWLKSTGATPEKGLASLQKAVETGTFNDLRMGSMQSVGQLLDSMKPVTVTASSSVYDPRTKTFVQAPAAPAAPTDLQRNYEFAKTPAGGNFKGSLADFKVLATPKTTTNITNVAEKAEAGEFGKLLVSEFSDLSKTANLAIKTLPSIDANLNILDKGFATGFGTETKAAGAKVLAALGVADAEKFATNAQIFQAKANEAVLQKQLEQKGPQTQSDRELIQTTGAQLGTTTQGNKFLLTVAKEQLKRDIEQRDFYRKWRERTGSFNGAEDAWFAGEGSKSLFDRPGLKQYLAPTSAASQIPGSRPAPAPAATTGGNTVSLPDGRTMSFPNAAAAAQFKKAAGL